MSIETHRERLSVLRNSRRAADCRIATIATTHNARLIHCDSDFEPIFGQAGMKTIDWTSALSRSPGQDTFSF